MDHPADRRALPEHDHLPDPFHIVKAATDALDEIRREVWNEARRAGNKQLAKDLKGARFALWKNAAPYRPPAAQARDDPTDQQTPVPRLPALPAAAENYRANAQDALALLEAWLQWARRSRLEPFRKLARRITQQRDRVEAAFTNNLSNARVEQINTQIRLIMRRGFGDHTEEAVIALAMLSLGGLCPPLPGR